MPTSFKPVGILLLVPYYRQLLYLAANLFVIKCKNHIWSAFKEPCVTFPACPTLAMEQPCELLFHLAPAVWADMFTCPSYYITGALQGFLQPSYRWQAASSAHLLLRLSLLLLLPLLRRQLFCFRLW